MIPKSYTLKQTDDLRQIIELVEGAKNHYRQSFQLAGPSPGQQNGDAALYHLENALQALKALLKRNGQI